MWIERIKIGLLFIICLLIGSFMLMPFRAQGQQNKAKQPAPAPAKKIDYERFTHKSHLGTVKVPETDHARMLNCVDCHERPSFLDISRGVVPTTDRNKQFSLKFPGHKACVECHVQQFTARPQLTCTICHETKQGLITRPPQRNFPLRYDFNAFFDAKQHELHATYLLPDTKQKTDCKFCHKQEANPAILTIPSHPACFVCHSPNSKDEKGSKKSDCKFCHTEHIETMMNGQPLSAMKVQPPSPMKVQPISEMNAQILSQIKVLPFSAMSATKLQPFSVKYVSRAYGALFTHKAHVEYMGGGCDMCHTISGGYNQPTPTSIRVKNHINSPAERTGRGCFSCHDGGMHYGRIVFSGEPGTDGGGSCNRCHVRNDFKVIASTGK